MLLHIQVSEALPQKNPSVLFRVPVDGVFCLILPLLILKIMADAVGMGEELCVGVKRNRVHVTGAHFNIAALWALWKIAARPTMKSIKHLSERKHRLHAANRKTTHSFRTARSKQNSN